MFEGNYEPIPDVIDSYEGHVHGALDAMIRVSGDDLQAAAELAQAYHQATSAEVDLMRLLSSTAHGDAHSHIESILSTSHDGEIQIQDLLSPESGGFDINNW